MRFIYLLTALLCFVVLLLTVAPTVYSLDSGEIAIGAATLGIIHAPGYPLVTLAGHAFTWLPVGDVGYRVNLFSALCLALTVPLLALTLRTLVQDAVFALAAALAVGWSYYVWTAGIVAEVYAPQMFALALAGWSLVHQDRETRAPLRTGALFGIALAVHPVSALFGPGVALAYRLQGVRWRDCIAAGLIAALIFLASLLYFPIRYGADPALNLAGSYATDGTFEPVNLRSLDGMWWLVSGRQFGSLFFAEGLLPGGAQVLDFARWFAGNFLGIGVLLGLAGAITLARRQRGVFAVWLALWLPYTYFYLTYGAGDRDTMFGPTYLLWGVPLAWGWRWLAEAVADVLAESGNGDASPVTQRAVRGLAVAFALLLLIVNYPLVNLHGDSSVRDRAQTMLDAIPQDAAVLGVWWDIVPLQYLHIVEDQRPDLDLYNLFLFPDEADAAQFLDHAAAQRQVVFVSRSALPMVEPGRYNLRVISGDPDALSGPTDLNLPTVYLVVPRE